MVCVTISHVVFFVSLQDGKHPLWYASYYGRDDLVLLFLKHKAVVNLPTNVRYSHMSISYKKLSVELDSCRYVATVT